jgi:hypothetical protein
VHWLRFIRSTIAAHADIGCAAGCAWNWGSVRFEKSLFGFLHGTGVMGVLAKMGLLDGTVQKIATDNLRYVPFTQLSNLTGTPSMSVPLHWTADGLPLGVQFVGPFGSEDRLAAVGAPAGERAAVARSFADARARLRLFGPTPQGATTPPALTPYTPPAYGSHFLFAPFRIGDAWTAYISAISNRFR